MPHTAFASRFNLDLIEDYYRRWQAATSSVDERWQAFFEGFDLAGRMPGTGDTAHTNVVRMVYVYRNAGHLQANLDPLSDKPAPHPLLALSEFDLSEADLDRTFDCSAFLGMKQAKLRELRAALEETYCGNVGVEFLHIRTAAIRRWIEDKIEPRRMRPSCPSVEAARADDASLCRVVRAISAHALSGTRSASA